MYYRRKLLLAILQRARGSKSLSKIDLQKILFLVCHKQKTGCFDFVPYKYGCFSFQSQKDLSLLSRHYRLIDDSEGKWTLCATDEDYFSQLKQADKEIVTDVLQQPYAQDTELLVDEVYDRFPYFTIHSQRELTQGQESRRKQEIDKLKTQRGLFSIGYEGRSIDAYLNLLVENNIKLLCDVRKNPISMKYGFSKRQLMSYCENLDMLYIHLPDLGIESEMRKNLDTAEDYQRLFQKYKSGLKRKTAALQELKGLLAEHKRIALTCFEGHHSCCHRGTLIDYYHGNIERVRVEHL